MKIMRAIVLAALPLLLASCYGEPKSKVTDGDFAVERLFDVDGCTVYRFRDGGSFIYFSSCKGTTQWSQSCGDNCTRKVQVPTMVTDTTTTR